MVKVEFYWIIKYFIEGDKAAKILWFVIFRHPIHALITSCQAIHLFHFFLLDNKDCFYVPYEINILFYDSNKKFPEIKKKCDANCIGYNYCSFFLHISLNPDKSRP